MALTDIIILKNIKGQRKKAAVYSLRNKGLITLCDSVPGCDFWIINISEEGKDLMEISPKLRYRQIKKFFNKQTSMRMRFKKVLFSINVFLKSIISILNK